MRENSQRLVIKDKKKEVKSTISTELKEAISRLSYITRTPVKDVCHEICVYGITNKLILGDLAVYFKRNVRIDNTYFNGSLTNRHVGKKVVTGSGRERISLRMPAKDYEVINVLAYGLDCSPSRVCAILMEEVMLDFTFVDEYVRKYLAYNLGEEIMKELLEIMRYTNKNNDERENWGAMWSAITDEVRSSLSNTKEIVSEFIVKHWKE